MIAIQMSRKKDGQNYDQGINEYSLNKAVKILFENELGFGGTVTEITKVSITVVTRVMGCVDTTIITGLKEEMLPLIQGVRFFLKASDDFKEEIFSQAFNDLKGDQDGVTPLLMQIGFGIIHGANRLKAAVMYACGITDKETILIGLKAKLKDIFAAIELQQEGCGVYFSGAKYFSPDSSTRVK
jgi:hypothetical protein